MVCKPKKKDDRGMIMKKKYWCLILISLTMVVAAAPLLWAAVVTEKQTGALNKQMVDTYMEADDATKEKLKGDIIRIVMDDAGKSQMIETMEGARLKILKSNLIPEDGGADHDERLFLINLAPNRAIAVVYKGYAFKAVVDTFMEIKDFQIMPIDRTSGDLVVVREYVDQMVGAFEEGTYVRGYVWDGKAFVLALNVIDQYDAYWNELWDTSAQPTGTEAKAHWLKVSEQSDIMWNALTPPSVHVVSKQEYLKSTNVNSVDMPASEQFELVKTNTVDNTYDWSEKWKHFILSEGMLDKNKEEVAILESSDNSPFYVAGLSDQSVYRIKKKDGTVEMVDQNRIERIDRLGSVD